MPRILVWNIQFFSMLKMKGLPDDGGQVRPPIEGLEKRDAILNTIEEYNPDIFVIVEVRSSLGQLGGLVGGSGANASIYLLKKLRKYHRTEDWCLVPPQRLLDGFIVDKNELVAERQYTEGISVFYKNRVLDFTGPYIWPLNAPAKGEKVAVPNTGAASGPYPDPWANCLPANNYFAGQCHYPIPLTNPPEEILFVEKTQRRIFRTNFVERGGTNRNISLYSLHFPPVQTTADQALSKLADVPSIMHPQAGEVIVVAGDFNVNLLGKKAVKSTGYPWVASQAKLYRNFTTASGSTVYTSAYKATPDYYKADSSFDNILTNNNAVPANAQIIDRVVDQPYAGETIPFYMSQSLNSIKQAMDPEGVFQSPDNFGTLAAPSGVSDHMPLVLDF